MHPTVQQLCEAMAWTAERVLLPELRTTYARIQARDLAKLLRWLGSVSDEKIDLARARSAGLRRGLEGIAAGLHASTSREARALADEIGAHLADAPADTALAADAEKSRRLQARTVALLPTLGDTEAGEVAGALHAAIIDDITAELTAGLPPSTFEELTQADLMQQYNGEDDKRNDRE